MKFFSKIARKRIENTLWLLGSLVWAIAIIATSPPIIAVIVITTVVRIVVYARQIVLAKILWQEKRRINSQANAHQRGYILQRLKELPYVNDSYSTRDPLEEKTFTVRHHLDVRLSVIYTIEFVENEYIGPADIGNEYRRTVRSYQLSPKWSKIRYEEFVALRYSGKVEYHASEAKSEELDHLPDDVIESIEYALINWQPVLHDQ